MDASGVYAILVSVAIIMSIVLAMLLVFHPPSFIVVLALYIIGVSIYSYVYFRRNPNTGSDQINYDVNKLITIFNIGLGCAILIIGIIVPTIRAVSFESGSGSGRYSGRY